MIKNKATGIFELLKIYSKCSHLNIISRDLLRVNKKIYPDKQHLQAAIEWLRRGQDITRCGGVSGGYFFVKVWMSSYPETTGYIIPTFLKYASLNNNNIERAIFMGDWEIEIQMPSGAVRGEIGVNRYPIVFNTGQKILGWISLYIETKMYRFLAVTTKAADWLLSIQDSDGKWRKNTYMDIPHVYHTRVAWPLLQLYKFTDDKKYKIAAEKQIVWALAHAKENGWFSQIGFNSDEIPLTIQLDIHFADY